VHKAPSIAIVDDNLSVRRAIANLVESAGFEAHTFASAEEFLKARPNCDTECLILDMRMPGMCGLELQSELLARNDRIPIIFMSAHGDDSARAQGLNAGAVAFLGKPWDTQELLDAVQLALEMN